MFGLGTGEILIILFIILLLFGAKKLPELAKGLGKGVNEFKKASDNIKEEVIIEDIPLNKRLNVIIRMSAQNQLDVYINGALVKRHIMSGVPKQNYGNVYESMNGGFYGYTSELQY